MNNDLSYLSSLQESSKLIREITKEHNEFTSNKITSKKAVKIAYAQIFGVNSTPDSENFDLDIAMKEMKHQMDILDYLSWGTNYQTRSYNIFFLTLLGNWHTGNSKTMRRKAPFHIDGDAENSGDDSIYLSHLTKGGMCGAQMYGPHSRKIQLKQTRKATEYMDALTRICCNILNNKKKYVSKKFSRIVEMIRDHLVELKRTASNLSTTNTSIRIECLMKIELFPEDDSSYFKFPHGFLDAKIGVCSTKDLGRYYDLTVGEACDSLLSIFHTKSDDELHFKFLKKMSPEAKTACVYHSEMLAMEFGAMNLKGSIIKLSRNIFMEQGSYNILENSKLRLRYH